MYSSSNHRQASGKPRAAHALVLALLLCFFTRAAFAQTNILFVGNSFTHGNSDPVLHYNNSAITDANASSDISSSGATYGGIPGIFKKLTTQAGLSYNVTIEAVSSMTLAWHYANEASAIAQPQWNDVILQDYSTEPLPANRGGSPATNLTGVSELQTLILNNAPSANIYMYETWAYPAWVFPAGSTYYGSDLTAMQDDLQAGYYTDFYDYHVTGVTRVGDAFMSVVNQGYAPADPDNGIPSGMFNLWLSDDKHPSIYGAYLSAALFFEKITGVDPRTLTTGTGTAASDLGISQTYAQELEQVAYQINSQSDPASPAAAPVIFTGTSVSGTTGLAFSYAIEATNGPTSFSSSTLPSGLTLSSSTGLISGMPTQSGTFSVTLDAINSYGSGSTTLTLTVAQNSAPNIALAVNCGGTASGLFLADEDYSLGSTGSTGGAIDTSAVSYPAPQAVYLSNRYGTMSYTLPGFTVGTPYTVRLHFAETYWAAVGKREFNVSINGSQVLTNYDIFATSGTYFKANVQSFTETPNASGQFVIAFTNVVDNAQINGIEIDGPPLVKVLAYAASSASTTSGSGPLNWNGTASWVGGVLPSTGNAILINGSSAVYSQVATGVSGGSYASYVSSLSFDIGASNFYVQSNNSYTNVRTLPLNGGGDALGGSDLIHLSAATTGTAFVGATGVSTIGPLDIILDAAGSFDVENPAATLALGQFAYLTGANSLTKTGAGTMTLGGTNASTYGGAGQTFAIDGGTVRVTGSGAIANAATALAVASGTLDLNGYNETMASLQVGDAATAGSILGATGTLTFGSFDARSGAVYASLSGSGALTKTTTNSLLIASAVSCAGSSNVYAGSLLVTGTFSGPLTVVSGTLGGTGLLSPGAGNQLAISAGGAVAPGQGTTGALSVAGQNIPAVSFASGASMLFKLNSAASPKSDCLSVTSGSGGSIAFSGNAIAFNDLTGGQLTPGAYTLFTANSGNAYSGITLDGNGYILSGLSIGAGLSAYPASTLQLVGNNIVLNLVQPALNLWRYTWFGLYTNTGNAADTANPAQDGVVNLLKYATGISPLASAVQPATIGRSTFSGSTYLALTFNRIADPTLTYSVQATNSLASASWATVWSSTGSSNVAGAISVSDVVPISSQPSRFLRLTVSH